MRILKFYKDDCGPCDEIEPTLSSISSTYNIPVECIDNTRATAYAMSLNVYTNPTIILVDDHGSEITRHIGIITENELLNIIQQYYNAVE